MDAPQDKPPAPTGFDPTGLDLVERRAAELLLRLLALGLILYGGYALLRPFLSIFLWAIILATALKPLHDGLTARLGGRPRLAATLMTIGLLLIAIGPVAALADSLIGTVKTVAEHVAEKGVRVPTMPAFVTDLPLVGDPIQRFWASATSNMEATLQKYGPLLMPPAGELIGLLGAMAKGVLGVAFAVLLTGILLAASPGLTEIGRKLADRLAGSPNGTHVILIATRTIRSVSRGVVGVAVLQALLTGIVLQVFGVAGAGLLAFVGLILCIVQIGLIPIVAPVLIWAWMSVPPGHALMMTVLLVPIMLIDNVLKPLLMSRGLETPASLMLVGVIGGTLSAGVLGVFVGPIVLAVLHDLAREWIGLDEPARAEDSPPTPDPSP